MANIGSCEVKAASLWDEPAFRALFEEPWSVLQDRMNQAGGIGVVADTSTHKVAKAIMKYAPASARKLFADEFLQMQIPDYQIRCMLREKDAVTSYRKYTFDTLISTAIAAIFPDREVACRWFIDGLGEGGSFTWKNFRVKDKKSWNYWE